MAKSTRHKAQDKMSAAINGVTNAAMHLENLTDVYKEHYPDIADPMTMYQLLLLEIKEGLERIKESF